jgi:hypothetical protein
MIEQRDLFAWQQSSFHCWCGGMPNYTRNDLAQLGRTEDESHDILLRRKRNLQRRL